MIRRRYRSRKPVESSQSAAAAAAPLPSQPLVEVAAAGSKGGCGNESGTLQNMALHTNGAREGFSLQNNNNSFCQLQMEPFPNEVSKKEYRYI